MKLKKQFDALHQRIFYNYKLCLSPFRPIKSDIADEQSQAQMHKLCGDILNILYNRPELINIKVEPDDCYQLYVCNNRKPELIKSYRKAGEQMKNLYHFLCNSVICGNIVGNKLNITLDQKQIKTARNAMIFLPYLGFEVERDGSQVILTSKNYYNIFSAMRLLANTHTMNGQITGKTLFAFAMGLFDGKMDYLIDMFEREMELEQGFFIPYFKQMKDKGYRTEHNYDWCAEGPTFIFRFYNEVSGVRLCYDIRKIHQLYFSLDTQIGVKVICEDFDKHPEYIQDYLLDRLSDCNNCMGCTKGGKNEKFAVEVIKDEVTRILCPQSIWIGFQVEFMNHSIMKSLVDFSELQAQYGSNWRKTKKKIAITI